MARRRFAKRLEDEERQRRGTSIVEVSRACDERRHFFVTSCFSWPPPFLSVPPGQDAGAPREDVQATVALLEAKLTSLRQTERAERLDLSALKVHSYWRPLVSSLVCLCTSPGPPTTSLSSQLTFCVSLFLLTGAGGEGLGARQVLHVRPDLSDFLSHPATTTHTHSVSVQEDSAGGGQVRLNAYM